MTDGSDAAVLEELKKIRELLTPKPAPPPPRGMKDEFFTFLQQYKVLGLAVAFIMGLYLGAVVQALVKDIILPPISYLLGAGGGNAFENATVGGIFLVGDFALAVITFIIVAFVIFLIVKIATRWGLNK